MSVTISTKVFSPELSWGWDEAADFGTDGDYFVDAENGNDGNAGTSTGAAFATIGAALIAASGTASRIRVMGNNARYREDLNIPSGVSNGERLEILAYGTDRPIVTAGEPITGWTQCTSADEATVGSNYASIYKVENIATTNFVDDNPLAANLFENGEQLQLCIAWSGGDLDDKFFMGKTEEWFTADSTQTDGSNNILSYTAASVTAAYTAAQIENCIVYGITNPNTSFTSAVASVSGDVITLADQTRTYESSSLKDNFALINMLPSIEQGQWGYKDNGDGTCNLYLWPNDTANLSGGIDYCARANCADVSSCNHVTIKGIQFQQAAGLSGTRDGALVLKPFGSTTENVSFANCRFYGSFALDPNTVSAMQLYQIDNLTVQNCSFERAQNAAGVFLGGDVNSTLADTVQMRRLNFQRNYLFRTARSNIRAYTQRDAVIAHNKVQLAGLHAHGNKLVLYEQCHNVLVWGNVFIDCDGYATHQEASRLFWGFNWFLGTRASESSTSRAFQDQQNATDEPSTYLTGESDDSWFFNNACLPQPIGYSGTSSNAMSVTKSGSDVSWSVVNNLYHGHVVDNAAAVDLWSNNWNTGPDGAYNGNDTAANGADIYTDPANGDFTIQAGASIRAASTYDLSTLINDTLKPAFPQFGFWGLDALGNTFDATSPPVGPVEGYDYADLKDTIASVK